VSGRRLEVRGEARRLDVFLAAALGLGRRGARQLVESGRVRIDGEASRPAAGRSVAPGETVVVEGLGGHPLEVVAEPDRELVVVGRGEGWLAVDKPAGRPVHPLQPGETGTVLNAVAARHPEVQGVGEGGLRSGVVHRLDVDTSGVLVVATAPDSWTRWRDAFREHRVEKIYLAVVHGDLGPGEERLPLKVLRHRPARVGVGDPQDPATRLCTTRWKPLGRFGRATVLEVRPTTGFLHQIRATFAHLGHPLVGDVAYGGDGELAPRHLLHAERVKLDRVFLEAPTPPDFRTAVDRLR